MTQMKNAVPKTLEEHRDYLFSIVRLKLFFLARWQHEHSDEDFVDILRNRVDIFRKTDINPEGLTPVADYFHLPAWQNIEHRLQEIYQAVNGDEKQFEEQGFELLRPHIENRCERDFNDRSNIASCQCGFLRHDMQLHCDIHDALCFHIANDRCPESFFDDREHIKKCFNQLLDIAENQFHAAKICTVTWLNSVPKWVALFPRQWQENMSAASTRVGWHYGYWGQFINARGTFNAKAGEYLRRTGQMPYYPRFSWCGIKDMREHINSI